MPSPLRVVIDTNVLVFALWSADGKPADTLGMIPTERIQPYLNHAILTEYRTVLVRPKFRFSGMVTQQILALFNEYAITISASAAPAKTKDPADQVFYDVACSADAWLITGNMKHFPPDKRVVSPAQFLELQHEDF